MQTQMQTPDYVELQNEIKLFLANELEANRVTVSEIMAILLILGQTSTRAELEAFVEIFQDSFETLKSFTMEKTESEKLEVKDQVKETIMRIITTDPMRAAQLAKDAISKDISWEELTNKYPELNE